MRPRWAWRGQIVKHQDSVASRVGVIVMTLGTCQAMGSIQGNAGMAPAPPSAAGHRSIIEAWSVLPIVCNDLIAVAKPDGGGEAKSHLGAVRHGKSLGHAGLKFKIGPGESGGSDDRRPQRHPPVQVRFSNKPQLCHGLSMCHCRFLRRHQGDRRFHEVTACTAVSGIRHQHQTTGHNSIDPTPRTHGPVVLSRGVA